MTMRKFTPATMTKEELRALRHEIKFDMRSMALCLGVPSSTFQRYEDGSAAVPERVKRAALELRQMNETFNDGMGLRLDERIKSNPRKFDPNLS